jgi:sulfide:quinone oxidoreductase
MARTRIVVLGGGFAGLRAFHRLHSVPSVDVVLIDPREASLARPALPEVAFAGKPLQHALIPLVPIIERHGGKFLRQAVIAIDAPEGYVTVDSGERVNYDYLLLAVGAHKDYDAVPGFPEYGFSVCDDREAPRLARAVQAFTGGPVVVGAAKSTWGSRIRVQPLAAPCEGPIGEIIFMLDYELRRRKIRVRSPITAFSPGALFFEDVGAKVHEAMAPQLKIRDIDVIVNKELAALEPGHVRFADGSSVESAFSIIIPPYTGNQVITASGLGDERGFIPTDDSMRHLDHENIYAAGDATALAMPKLGHIAVMQADIAAAALIRAITGQGEVPAYRPEIFCIMNQGGAEALLILSDTLYGGKRDIALRGPIAHAMKWGFDSYYFYTRGNMPPDMANTAIEALLERWPGHEAR